MRKYLDTPKIDYILTHLRFRCDYDETLSNRFVFITEKEFAQTQSNKVIFVLSEQARTLDYQIDKLPIFYPLFPDINSHTFEKSNSLLFSHDILQQIFCLQTLFYEQEITERDSLGRVKTEATLNYKLNITHLPLVDYLFEVIVSELEQYAKQEKLYFQRRNLLEKPVLLLSHDVDRVETYSFWNLLNSGKKLIKAPSMLKLQDLGVHIREYFKFFKRSNPLWDFFEMNLLESVYKLKSTYYFLSKGKLHQDAYYSLHDPKIKQLMTQILNYGHEIGLHLTIKSNHDKKLLQQNLLELEQIINRDVVGVRSHWLKFDPLVTPDILEESGIKYDSSLGYYSKEGFRTGTCLPYKLYSFKQNKMLEVWEIPLIFMDCMILDYQDISQQEALTKLQNILSEVIKFKGIFTLLWHNGNFSNPQPYDRLEFYKELLQILKESKIDNLTASKLIEIIEENNR